MVLVGVRAGEWALRVGGAWMVQGRAWFGGGTLELIAFLNSYFTF